jgi:endoglucanase Acf2
VNGDTATTTLRYLTEGGEPTVVAVLPHQAAGLEGSPDCGLGTYTGVLGEMDVCATGDLAWSVPTLEPSGALDLSGLDESQKATLAEQVAADAAADKPFAADTYFGGKSLYRVVNLYQVARQVGADDVAGDLRTRVVDQIDEWAQPDGCEQREERCFVYDPAARGMVGKVPSFGSEEFNDHHFHYGYFLYAAGVMAAEDPALAERWAPVIDLLAADIATSGGSSFFPDRRVFDVYGGHSWASGTSPFGDGNNQESSSEAVTAWNGLALWAQASGKEDLEAQARWMLAAEAASALAYWTNFPLDEALYDGFDHTVTSLVWGGKRDYATWFSAEPSAMLGILVLPMSPVADYLAVDPDRVRSNLEDSVPDGYDVMFGDFLLMYSALAGPEEAAAALEEAAALSDERIDDGNTRSYLLAWIMAHA